MHIWNPETSYNNAMSLDSVAHFISCPKTLQATRGPIAVEFRGVSVFPKMLALRTSDKLGIFGPVQAENNIPVQANYLCTYVKLKNFEFH